MALGKGAFECDARFNVDRLGEVEPNDFGARVIRQGRDGEESHGLLLPLKGPPRFPAAARARRSGAIRVAGLKPTGRSLSLGNQANTRPKMPEYGLRSSSSASVAALPRRRRSTIANPVPSAQLTDAPKQTTRRGSGYSITSSARASSVGGTSRPSAFAVLRLMTNATRVDCSTGKSAGFSPLRMRST